MFWIKRLHYLYYVSSKAAFCKCFIIMREKKFDWEMRWAQKCCAFRAAVWVLNLTVWPLSKTGLWPVTEIWPVWVTVQTLNLSGAIGWRVNQNMASQPNRVSRNPSNFGLVTWESWVSPHHEIPFEVQTFNFQIRLLSDWRSRSARRCPPPPPPHRLQL